MQIFELFGSILLRDTGVENQLHSIDRTAAQTDRSMGISFSSITNAAKKIGTALGAVGLMAAGYLKGSIESAAKGEENFANLTQTIKSTGKAAGYSADQIKAMSKELAAQTTFTGGEIMKGQNMLLTFTNIQGDVLKKASMAMLDLSQKYGTLPEQQAIALGKALNDPIKGITALTRVGVTFTQQQKDQIKAMIAVGDTAGAQNIILKELNTEFGGQASAAANTYNGQLKQMTNSINSIKGAIGSILLPYMSKAAFALNEAAQAVAKFATEHKQVIAIILGVTAVLGSLIGGVSLFSKVTALLGPVVSGLSGLIAGLSLPVLAVIGVIAALGAAYVKNFGGFKSFIDGLISKIMNLMSAFTGVSSIMNAITNKNISNMNKEKEAITDRYNKQINALKNATQAAGTSAKDIAKINKDAAKDSAKATKDAADDAKKAIDDEIKHLEKAKKEELAIVDKTYEQDVKNAKKASEARMKQYEAEYQARLKTLDSAEAAKLKALDDAENAIDAQTAKEDEAIKEKEYQEKQSQLAIKATQNDTSKARDFNEKQEKLQRSLSKAKDSQDRADIQQEINDNLADYQTELLKDAQDKKDIQKEIADNEAAHQREAVLKQRETNKKQLDDKKDLIKTEFEKKKDALKEEMDATKEFENEKTSLELEKLQEVKEAVHANLEDQLQVRKDILALQKDAIEKKASDTVDQINNSAQEDSTPDLVSLSGNPNQAKIDELNKQMEAELKESDKKIATEKSKIQTLGAFISASMAKILDTVIMPFMGKISEGAFEVVGVFREHWPEIQKVIDDVVTQSSNIFNNILVPVFKIVMDVIKLLIDFVVAHWPNMSKVIEIAIDIVVACFNDILLPALKFVIGIFSEVVKWVSDNWPLIRDTITIVLNAIWKVIENTLNEIKKFWDTWGGTITDIVSICFEGIKIYISAAIKIVQDILKAIMLAINGDWKGAWNALVQAVKDILGGLNDIINVALDGVEKIFVGLAEIAIKWGEDMIDGFVKGIKNKVTAVKDAINDVMKGVKGFLGFDSPPVTAATSKTPSSFNGSIGSNAGGTDNWRGGLTHINEVGGEIIDLPSGSRVIPHDISMEMAKNKGLQGGINFTITNFYNNRKQDVEELAQELALYTKQCSAATGGTK